MLFLDPTQPNAQNCAKFLTVCRPPAGIGEVVRGGIRQDRGHARIGHHDAIHHHPIGRSNAHHVLTSNASLLPATCQSSNFPHAQPSTSALQRYRQSHTQAICMTSSRDERTNANKLTPSTRCSHQNRVQRSTTRAILRATSPGCTLGTTAATMDGEHTDTMPASQHPKKNRPHWAAGSGVARQWKAQWPSSSSSSAYSSGDSRSFNCSASSSSKTKIQPSP